jgi:hypothetical protein
LHRMRASSTPVAPSSAGSVRGDEVRARASAVRLLGSW